MLDPQHSVAGYFAVRHQELRAAAGYTQRELAKVMNYSPTLVTCIERCERLPTAVYAEHADVALHASGELVRLQPLVRNPASPPWFHTYPLLEASAVQIRALEIQVMPGLLQTEDYARAVLRTGDLLAPDAVIDERVRVRLERQQILSRDEPPLLWVVLDESVLYRQVGGGHVMRDQLAHLLRSAAGSRTQIQILPLAKAAEAPMFGRFTILNLEEKAEVVWSETAGTGQELDHPDDVAACTLAYDQMRAAALDMTASLALITKVMEELDEPDTDAAWSVMAQVQLQQWGRRQLRGSSTAEPSTSAN
jgi:transcriptional regulator with XRE-family HTH domain